MSRTFHSRLVSVLFLVGLSALPAKIAVAQEAVGVGVEQKRILLLAQGPDGHPEGTHEYVAGLETLAGDLKTQPNLHVELIRADEPWAQGPELLERADGVVLYLAEGAKWIQADERRHQAFNRLAQRGGGLVCIHWAMGTRDAKYIDGFVALFGGCHGGPDRRHKIVETNLLPSSEHPIAQGISEFQIREELYYQLKFPGQSPVTPILQARIDDQLETVAWAWQRPEGGRSFGYSGMHFLDNWQNTHCRRLIANSVLWSLDLPVPEQGEEGETSPTRKRGG